MLPDFHEIHASLDELSAVLDESQIMAIAGCISAVLQRVLVGRLVTDEAFRVIREMPDVYSAETASRIELRLSEIGIAGDRRKALVPKLKTMLLRGEGYGARSALMTEGLLRSLFASLARDGFEQLRCHLCGYHFCREDLSSSRLKIAENAGLELCHRSNIARRNDPIKSTGGTALEIDHIIPRAGWGPSDVANLQPLCRLCNQGKMIFEMGAEAVSVVAAAAYSLSHSAAYAPNATIFYSCIAMNGSKCMSCGRLSREVELTTVPTEEWFTPWTCKILCYDCYLL